MAIYLIDYENVYIDGLQGIDRLGEEDVVHIFYTQNRCGLTFGLYEQLLSCRAKVQLNEVGISPKNNDPVKNALDIQLMMFTGFLIGSKASGSIFIISKDKDFLLGSEFFTRYIPDDGITLRQVASVAEGLQSLEPPAPEPEEPAPAPEPLTDFQERLELLREEYRPYSEKVVKKGKPRSLASIADQYAREEAVAAPLYSRIDIPEEPAPVPEPEAPAGPQYTVQYFNTVRNLLGKDTDEETVSVVCGIIGDAEDLVALNNGLALYYRDNDRAKTVYHKCKPRFEDLRHLAHASQRRGK